MKSQLTADDLFACALKLKRVKPYPVGIVCRPDALDALKIENARNWTAHSLTGNQFAGLPIYEKNTQAEPHRVFYDKVELQKYLNEPAPK